MATDHRGKDIHAGKRTSDEMHEQMTAEQNYHAGREATDKLFGYAPTIGDGNPKELWQLVGKIQHPNRVSKRDYQPKLASGTWVFPIKQDLIEPNDPKSEPFQV